MQSDPDPQTVRRRSRRRPPHASGGLRGFIQARILLQLLQEPGHGYALLERLSDEPGMLAADPGLLYRTLRQMENDGWVLSAWDTGGQGPARREYEVTAEGIEALHAWAVQIGQTRDRLNRFLDQYHETFAEA